MIKRELKQFLMCECVSATFLCNRYTLSYQVELAMSAVHASTLAAPRRALKDASVEFIGENGGGPDVCDCASVRGRRKSNRPYHGLESESSFKALIEGIGYLHGSARF